MRSYTLRRKSSMRHTRKRRRNCNKKSGGGYTVGPNYINPGNLAFNQYSGYGKDCVGDFTRPGYISNYNERGLPGLSGGRRRRRGGAFPMVAPFTDASQQAPVPQVPVQQVQQAQQAQQAQKGGRYGFFPAHLSANGVGLGRFESIPCESGTLNSLNPNPHNIQGLTTGGRRRRSRRTRRSRGGAYAELSSAYAPIITGSQAGTYQVGAADSMRYYAPNAGYEQKFETFPIGSPNPGLTINVPYAASAFNRACLGGSRRRRSRRRR